MTERSDMLKRALALAEDDSPDWLLLSAIAVAQRILEEDPRTVVTREAWRELENGLCAYEAAANASFCIECKRRLPLGDDAHECEVRS